MQKTKMPGNKIYPYLVSVGLVLIMTLLGEFVKRRLEPTNIVMFYLLAVVIAAIRWGQGPAIITGTYIEVINPNIEKLQDKLARENHFVPLKHKLQIFGVCSECSKRSA